MALAAASHLCNQSGVPYLTHLTSSIFCLLKLQDMAGDSALHMAVAALAAGTAAAEALLARLLALTQALGCSEALLTLQNLQGESPLHMAAAAQLPRAAAALLQHSAAPLTLQDGRGDTPLHAALRRGGGAALPALLDHRPNAAARRALIVALQTYNYQGNTPLHEAVARGQLASVRLLAQTGVGVHLCERRRGANPLHLAVLHQRSEIAAFLIQHTNITVNSRLLDGSSTLQLAQQKGDEAICRLLVEAGAEAVVSDENEEENGKSTRSTTPQSDKSSISSTSSQSRKQPNYTTKTVIKTDGSTYAVKDGTAIPVKEGTTYPVKEGAIHPIKEGTTYLTKEGITQPIREATTYPVKEGAPPSRDALGSTDSKSSSKAREAAAARRVSAQEHCGAGGALCGAAV